MFWRVPDGAVELLKGCEGEAERGYGCSGCQLGGFWSGMDGGFTVNFGKGKENPYVRPRSGCFIPEQAPLGRLLPLDNIEDTLWDVWSGEIRF